ncbi:hypothetical protein [Marinobacter mobilis]|uniref:hypothetical protein n=1 Tax=Marinobacter mobilis TaxID=488533 RepID=UPI0035C74CED
MEAIEAKILLKNLLKRIRRVDEDCYELSGSLTDDEMIALQMALVLMDRAALSSAAPSHEPVQAQPVAPVKPLKRVSEFTPAPTPPGPEEAVAEPEESEPGEPEIEIDTSALELPVPPSDRRLCLDFGTAMSKVTLVKDATAERGYEDVEVLMLGVPGDQEEVSETMLVSSVFIDGEGLVWFGNMAVQRSTLEAQDGSRQRLDNIKRYLSEEGLNNKVLAKFNPTEHEITYGDMVLAYLMFLTWTVNQCLENSGEPRNINRRFAMPCFDGSKSRNTSQTLRSMLGEAQVLADTFYKTLHDGIPLASFLHAVTKLREENRKFGFVMEDITEPLGVAGSIMSWEEDVDSLIMIVDVGAGTSDFSLYRMHFDEKSGKSTALEVENSTQGITEAGNHLDGLLRGLILKKAGVDSNHEHWVNILGNLELDLRDYKERLFLDQEVTVRLFNDELVTIQLNEFLSLEQVVKFGDSLKACRDQILSRVDPSFVKGAPFGALGLALTGGGATLPMVKALAKGVIQMHGKELKLVQTKAFPKWLKNEYPELETDYPRIAVSLGGARKRIIDRGGVARVTAGDVKGRPMLEGYYTKG